VVPEQFAQLWNCRMVVRKGLCFELIRFAADSPLEADGFEPRSRSQDMSVSFAKAEVPEEPVS